MAEINDLNITDASNTDRFPENQSPSSLNDGARALEGLIARWHKDTNGSTASTGSANAYVFAANQTLSAYYDGLEITFDANHTNTGASTLNVDAVGAASIVWPDGSALSAGDITSGAKVTVRHDGTNWQLGTVVQKPGTAALLNTGVSNGQIPVMDATGYPAADGSQITNLAWTNIAGRQLSVYDFTDTSDVSIATVTPTGTLWSSSQAITIPTSGLIAIVPYLRIDNASGSNRSYSIGLRINGTDYFMNNDSNGTLDYQDAAQIVSGQYQIIKSSQRLPSGAGPTGWLSLFDIEGLGISTGSQTVQPVIGSDAATATQTLKGTTVTARLKVFVFDFA